MPDPAADPLTDYLRRAPLSDQQRAVLWDTFQSAANEDDLTEKLKPLKIPNPIKAGLWDLKYQAVPATAPPAGTVPTPGVPVQGPVINGQVYPMGIDTADVGRPGGPQPLQGPVVRGQLYPLGTDTADIPAPPPPQRLAGLGIKTVSDEDWNRMTPQERFQGLVKAAGLTVGNMLGMGTEATTEQLEHPKTTLALAAVPALAKGAKFIPTRVAAGLKFEEVMRAVGDKPVDIAKAGDVALRVTELAERGGTMPKVVRDLLRRATDPTKADITYREMRDFYSNVSRLSADEMQRLPPIVKAQIGDLRVALDEALAKTAASGGKEGVYRAAMREYRIATRMRDIATAAAKSGVKWGAGLIGAGAAYKVGKEILD